MGRGCPRLAPNDGEAQPRQHGIDRGPPDQIRAVESRGGTGGGGVGRRGWGKVRRGKVEEGWREVGWDEGDAFRAGGDDIDALAAVVGKGGAKGEGAIPVRGPSVAVVGTGEGKTELAGGVKGVGVEIVWEMV